jgi:hypothetical protein
MSHHHTAALVGVWVALFASWVGAAIAIFAGILASKQRGAGRFDPIQSARRIRARPIA